MATQSHTSLLQTLISRIFIIVCIIPLCGLKNIENCESPQAIVEFLVDQANLPALLQKTLYERTHSIREAYPFLSPTLTPAFIPECLSWKISLFYNGIPDGVYFDRHNDTSLTSVLDVSSLNLCGSSNVMDMIFKLPEFQNINFPVLGDLFDNIIVQQHRLGGMFNINYSGNCYFVQAFAPLMYQIDNVYIEPEIQERFSDELTIPFATFEFEADRNAVEDFIKNHMVADRIGIGNFDLIAGRKFEIGTYSAITVALEGIFPTNINFKKGLIGGNFSCNYIPLPPFSLDQFIAKIINPQNGCFNKQAAFDTFFPIFENMLNRMTAAYYDAPLGQNNFSIGLQSVGEFSRCGSVYLGYLVRGLYQIPHHATRFAYAQTPASSFNLDYKAIAADSDPAPALETLDFFSRQFLYRLLLQPLEVKRNPGALIQGRLYCSVRCSDIHVTFGGDAWAQERETVEVQCKPALQDNSYFVYTIQQACGQFKIFGNIEGTLCLCDTDLVIGAFGDATLFSSGIGKDFTLGLSIGTTF